MIVTLLRAAGLAAIYLLVLTSVDPGDVAIAALLGLGIAFAVRPRERRRTRTPGPGVPSMFVVLAQTLGEIAVGTWRTVRFCLSTHDDSGFVEVPRDGRSRHNVALWGVLTGEAPDEVVVDVDVERDVLIVHLVDATDPDAVRERHAQRTAAQRKWVP